MHVHRQCKRPQFGKVGSTESQIYACQYIRITGHYKERDNYRATKTHMCTKASELPRAQGPSMRTDMQGVTSTGASFRERNTSEISPTDATTKEDLYFYPASLSAVHVVRTRERRLTAVSTI